MAPLSTVMRRLMTGYAQQFNRRHNCWGVLFQNRYQSFLCEEEPYLLELVRYIHLNPDPNAIERVIFELTVNTRWLESFGIIRPSDFLKTPFNQLVKQVKFLDLDQLKIGRALHNRISGGNWVGHLRKDRRRYGMCHTIIERRKEKVCPVSCRRSGSRYTCRQAIAANQGQTHGDLVKAVQRCSSSVPQLRFEDFYCKPSIYHKAFMALLRKGYKVWVKPSLGLFHTNGSEGKKNRRQKIIDDGVKIVIASKFTVIMGEKRRSCEKD